MSDDQPVLRRRGAPKGNTNALKNGFYSKRLPARTAREVESTSFPGLHDEIMLLRALIGDVVQHAGEAQSLEQRIDVLRAVTFSTVSLARLLRVGSLVDKDTDHEMFNAALDKVIADMAAQGLHL